MYTLLTYWAGFYRRQAYVHVIDLLGRLLQETGLCVDGVHVLQVHTMQSMHARIQYVGVVDMTSALQHKSKSGMCKLRLLFKSGLSIV